MLPQLTQDPTTHTCSSAALLRLRKLPSAGMLGPRLPDTQLYVVRYKRKRLAITPVEIDPDAEERQKAAVAAAVKGESQVVGSGGSGKGAVGKGREAAGYTNAAKGLEF